MANGINKVIIVGRLGKDPEMRYTPAGVAVASFSLAVSESWTDKNTGQKQERTEWINCTAFKKVAEIIGQYVKKGSQIYVEGSIKTEKYADKTTGADRYSTKIMVRDMQMLGAKGDGGQSQQRSQQGAPPASQDFGDDIAFNNHELRMLKC